MESFRVLSFTSVNRADVGDIYEIDGNMAVVTKVSNRYAYIDGVPHHRKMIGTMKRNFIKQYRDGKSWLHSH